MTPTDDGAITVWWGDHAQDLLAAELAHLHQPAAQPLTLIPSSLTRDDPALHSIRGALRALGVRQRVAVPKTNIGSLIGASRFWQRLSIGNRSVRIDGRVLSGMRIGVVSITLDRRLGPFALDLAAHFLHPLHRARLLLSHNPSSLVADIAAACVPDFWIISTSSGDDRLWLTTDDIVAAELWSLALAERFFDTALEMKGPWEDPTVQRATELELGARIPAEMRLRLGSRGELPESIGALLVAGCRRLGMRVPAELA